MTPEALAAHYASVDERCRRALSEDEALDYLGVRPGTLARRLGESEIAAHFDGVRFAAGFATEEVAIDTDALASGLRQAAADSAILTLLLSHRARSVAQTAHGFRVEGEGPEGPWSIAARQVVNATWEQRVAFDRQLGLPPPAGLLHRLKYRVIARVPEALRQAPSVSMVLGRYGDVVIRSDGTAYLSWYPAGLRGWTHEVEPPEDWETACRGEVPRSPRARSRRASCAASRRGSAAWSSAGPSASMPARSWHSAGATSTTPGAACIVARGSASPRAAAGTRSIRASSRRLRSSPSRRPTGSRRSRGPRAAPEEGP